MCELPFVLLTNIILNYVHEASEWIAYIQAILLT